MSASAEKPRLDPYRPFFGAGLATAVAVVILWALRLSGVVGGDWALAPFGLHGHWMLWGVVQSFAWGFACTAFPRQHGGRQLAQGPLVRLASVHALGLLAAVAAGLPAAPAVLFGLGLALQFSAGVALWLHLLAQRRAAPPDDDPQPAVFLASLVAGLLLMAAHGIGLLMASHGGLQIVVAAGHLAVAFWLPALILSTAARVVPMFAGRGIDAPVRPASRQMLRAWALLTLPAALLTGGAWWWAGLWPVAWLVTLAATLVAVVWVTRWIPGRRVWVVPMVAWLFVGLFLVLAAQGFTVVELIAWWREGSVAAPRYHRAALHTLGLGGAMTMIVAVASRVITGHAGMAMRATVGMHLAMAGILSATVIRVAAALRPDWWGWTGAQGAYAGWPFAIGMIAWAWTYVPRLMLWTQPNREMPVVPFGKIRPPEQP